MVSPLQALLKTGHPAVGLGEKSTSRGISCTRRRNRTGRVLLFTGITTLVASLAAPLYLTPALSTGLDTWHAYQQRREEERRADYKNRLRELGWKSPYTPRAEEEIDPLRFKAYQKCSEGRFINTSWREVITERNHLERGGHETWRCNGETFTIFSSAPSSSSSDQSSHYTPDR
jgi:hypothetical protein